MPDKLVTFQDLATLKNEYDGLMDGMDNDIANRVVKESGKQLSSNDYTDQDKQKLQGIQPGAQVNVPPLINITHGLLKTLRDSGNLVPGRQYRITDYEFVSGKSGTKSANHQFDIIVVADSTNKLSENARACLHEGDTYFANNNLNAWRLKYCLDNDTTRFAWASSSGKGVIYEMEDEFGNCMPYDFKNLLYAEQNLYYISCLVGQSTKSFNRSATRDQEVGGVKYYGWYYASGQTAIWTRALDLKVGDPTYNISDNTAYEGNPITGVAGTYRPQSYTIQELRKTSSIYTNYNPYGAAPYTRNPTGDRVVDGITYFDWYYYPGPGVVIYTTEEQPTLSSTLYQYSNGSMLVRTYKITEVQLSGVFDYTINLSTPCRHNVIRPYRNTNGKLELNQIFFANLTSVMSGLFTDFDCHNIYSMKEGVVYSVRVGHGGNGIQIENSSEVVIGRNCSNITIGASGNSYRNLRVFIGDYCASIEFGGAAQDISVGDGCQYIRFGDSSNIIGWLDNVHIQPLAKYLYITTNISSSAYKIQNLLIGSRIVGSSSANRTTLDITANSAAMVEYHKSGKQEVYL